MLNGASEVDFREGNLFEPVAGETFDLIVCNPPYVISPETDIAYRDGGLPGDSFSETIVRALPAHLAPGGVGEVLVSWLHPREGDWTAPVRRWVEGGGCDAILLRYAMQEPLDYAAGWNRPYRTNPELYGAAIERWTSYFDRLGVEAISWGALIMRRREGDNWFFPYSSTTDRITGASEQVLRLLRGARLPRDGRPGGAPRAPRSSVVPEHRIEQTIRLRDGGEAVERNVLRLDNGLRFEVSIDASTERVLALLDGRAAARGRARRGGRGGPRAGGGVRGERAAGDPPAARARLRRRQPGSRLDKAFADRGGDGLRAAAGVELRDHVVDHVLHRALAVAEPLRDLAGGVAVGDEPQHLLLPNRQRGEREPARLEQLVGGSGDRPSGGRRAGREPGLPIRSPRCAGSPPGHPA